MLNVLPLKGRTFLNSGMMVKLWDKTPAFTGKNVGLLKSKRMERFPVTSQRSSFLFCNAAHVQILAVFSVPAGGGVELRRSH